LPNYANKPFLNNDSIIDEIKRNIIAKKEGRYKYFIPIVMFYITICSIVQLTKTCPTGKLEIFIVGHFEP